MASKALPSPEVLRQLLRYEPDTGKLFWLPRPTEMFEDGRYSADRACRMWNAKNAGHEALTALNDKGYHHGKIFGRLVAAHRVVMAMIYGRWPEQEVDHENGVRSDNRQDNLRDANHAENMKNKRRQVGPPRALGLKRRHNKWTVRISSGGHQMHVGTFECFGRALAERRAAEKNLGFHKNHGRSSM